jgi:DNA primase
MGKYYTRDYLHRIRNEIPVASLLRRLDWPTKYREGEFFSLCPSCQEFLVKETPEANLGHCFGCDRNFNPIDFTMLIEDVEFVAAVEMLDPLLPSPSTR